MRLPIVALILLSFVTLLGGCGTIEEGDPAAKTAIQFATLKFIDEDSERANEVIRTVQRVQGLVDEQTTTSLDNLAEQARAEIDWSELDTAEQLLVNNLIDVIKAKLEEEVGERNLDPNDVVVIRNVLDWVTEAAVMAGGTTNAFIGSGTRASARPAGDTPSTALVGRVGA